MTDRKIMNELRKSGSRTINASVLGDLATKYRVARGFKIEKNNPQSSSQRWEDAAERLMCVIQGAEDTKGKVCTLAKALGMVAPVKSGINANLLSAATKFLWFAGDHKVRILDKRAVDTLARLRGVRGKLGVDYAQYAAAWEDQLDTHKDALQEALANLPCQLKWTRIPSHAHTEAKAVFKEFWFTDRIFDQYLWTLGAGTNDGATPFV